MPNGSTLITALQPVRPGDLIEADIFNKLIAAVQELDKRCSEPEKPTGEGERHPFVIDKLAYVEAADAIGFKVRGSGLKPAGLEAFFVNGYRVEATAKGTDNAITVSVNMGGHIALNMDTATHGFAAGASKPQLLILTLQNGDGETASGATEVP